MTQQTKTQTVKSANHQTKSDPTNHSAVNSGLSTGLKQHKAAAKDALHRLLNAPLSSLLTIFVVAIALSLPAALQVSIKNLEAGQSTVNEQASVTLFLKKDAQQGDINAIIQQLKNTPSILSVTFISADDALHEFQAASNLGNTLDNLKTNPLPASILITPDTEQLTINDIELLIADFEELEAVDFAQIDVSWIEKLFTIIELAKHFAIGISVFLIFAVLILIGNTIKNLGQNFQEEIAVSKLVGATDAFVRRPFLYSGLLYGLFGSVFALIFVFLGILWVTPYINELAALYSSQLSIINLTINDTLSLIAIGMILGLGGAWIAANRLISKVSL